MYSFQLKIILATAVIVFLSGYTAADDSDVVVNSIKYTNDFENGEAITLVESGRDEGTEYRYRIFDNDEDFPDDWKETIFDDGEWDVGNAPFGNKQNEGINPGTIWQSEDAGGNDGNKDFIILRKNFVIEDVSVILSGTIKSAYTNYYAVFLNGQEIEDCLNYSGYCYEGDAEYWNKDIDIDTNVFIDGNNTLVLVGRDSLWQGGDNTTWLDGELDIRVQTWKDVPIILGDELIIKVDFFNGDVENKTELNVTLEFEDTETAYETIDIEKNGTYEWNVAWTPSRLGTHNLTATILDQSLTKTIHVGYYAYSINFSSSYETSELDEITQFQFTVKNEGDVNDNFSFYLTGIPSDWQYTFFPSVADLEPNKTANVILNVTTSDNVPAGNYSLYPIIRSQYYSQTTNTIVASGAGASTEYKYRIWNASDFHNDFYTFEYDDSSWNTGAAPFGDDDLNGNEPNTLWETNDDNYTHIAARHLFNYDGDRNFSQIRINIAADNYYRAYLNGELIEDCLSWSWQCYGEGDYWDTEVTFNTSWLKEGENLLAIAGRDETYQGGNNQQWLDLEIETLNLKSSLWGFEEIYEELQLKINETHDFEIMVPISEKYIDEEEYVFTIWVINRGNVEDTYDINVSLNDTAAFNVVSYNEVLEIPYNQDRNIELKIKLTDYVNEFSIGNISITISSRNTTSELNAETYVIAKLYIIPDTLPPATYAESDPLVNNSSFEVRWFVEDWYKNNEIMGNDTKYFIIEYITDGGTNGASWSEWVVWQNFSSEQSSGTFTNAMDGYRYRFRSIGGDNEGLIEDKENKYDAQTIIDTSAPYAIINLRTDGNIINLDYIEIEWEVTHPNITGYTAQYRLNEGNWTNIEENSLAKWIGFNVPVNGEYQFRIITSDEAGNQGISDISETIIIDTVAPNTNIKQIPPLTSSNSIEIDLDNLEDTFNATLYYSVVRENQEIIPINWDKYGDYTISDFPVTIPLNNQFHYYFKIVAYDIAGNHILNESYQELIVDQDPPQKIRNLEISDTKIVKNGTTDVVISFMSSQSQDLTKYRIYRSVNDNNNETLVGELESGELYLSYRDSSVDIGYKYFYSVVAVDRMNLESENETGFIVLEIEQEVVEESGDEETNNTIFIGAGLVGLISLAGAAYYFVGKNTAETIVTEVAIVDESQEILDKNESKSNFTQMDGEFLCNACGAMFEMGEDRTCPSCGVFDELEGE